MKKLKTHRLLRAKTFTALLIAMGLCMNIQLLNAQSQKINVTGVVKDATGETVIGASVLEKGTTNGTITDIDGNFSLTVASNSTLVVSYIGYAAQEIAVGGKTFFNIMLKEDSEMLDEVVVVGYGTMRKKDLTGSVVQIRPDRLANEAPKTVQDVLRGTPGLNIGYSADAKGGGTMQVRGQRSVYVTDKDKPENDTHNTPLIILDGMQFYGELSEINPQDIGQIDVLKDASSAAIYGAKGANGVIVVTTKKGKTGKPTINFNSTIGINTKSDYRDVFNATDYMQYREDWYKVETYGVNPSTGRYEAYQRGQKKLGYYDRPENLDQYGVSQDQWMAYTTNTTGESALSVYARRLGLEDAVMQNFVAGRTHDWYDQTFRTGINQDYNVSVSGASERMNYYMSFGYQNNEGAVKGNDYQAMRANLKVSGKITDWLEIGANVNFQDRTDGDIQVGLGTNYWDQNMLRNSPYANYREEDGSLSQYPMGNKVKRGYNYDFERQYLDLDKGYTVLNTIFNAKVKLPYNITYDFNIAPRYEFFHNYYFMSNQLPDSNPKNRGVDRENSKRFDYSLNNTITWDHMFAEKHHVMLTLVQEAEERRYWNDKTEARNIQPSDALGFHNTQNATKEDSKFKTDDTHETAAAYVGRLFYSYDDRYMFTGTVRRDGYCAFGANNPWATFPSLSVAWSFANEKFFNWEPMSTGKLRVSWGKNGNRQLKDPYLALANLGSGTGGSMGYFTGADYVDMLYLSMDRLANNNLRWEKTSSWNFGLDFGFLNDRISGSLEAYFMKTNDMIMSQRLPRFSGFSEITTNLGEVANNGFELSVNTVNIRNKDFEWRTTFGFAYNQNKINHLYYEYEDVKDANGNVIGRKEQDDKTNGWFIGKPIGEIWDYKVTGIWQANEVEEAAKVGQRPGDPKVANIYTADDVINADGSRTPVYNDNDKQFQGTKNAPIRWSLRNEFTILKNLDVSFSLYSYMGHKSAETYYLNGDNGGSLMAYGFNTFEKEYWTPENPTNDYARLEAKGPDGAGSPKKVYKRDFIRLDNISVAYTLPTQLTKKWMIDRVKLYGTIRNVAVWAPDWDYADPETGGLATRTFTFGLNLTF